MPRLSETTAMLARLRRQAEQAPRPAGAPSASGMREVAAFGDNPGGLRMLLHVPADLPPSSPLVVTLHGCTQGAAAYADGAGWLALADQHGFAVLAPEQTPANNPNRCFNWFSPTDTRRGGGEAASIAAMVAHLVQTERIDPDRIFVTGLSAGGAMASALLAAYPDVFTAGAIIAGLPHGVASNVQQALSAMRHADGRSAADLAALVANAAPAVRRRPRVTVWHGSSDHTVDVSNAEAIVRQWTGSHGLPTTPDATQPLPGGRRELWRSPTSGETLVELNLLDGVGHGTPLATRGVDGVGAPAPFMLETGVSSSHEILRFWGLETDAPALRRAEETSPGHQAQATPDSVSGLGLGDMVMGAVARHVSPDVQAVIAKALRGAGLMR